MYLDTDCTGWDGVLPGQQRNHRRVTERMVTSRMCLQDIFFKVDTVNHLGGQKPNFVPDHVL
jgi:hypothetical protein